MRVALLALIPALAFAQLPKGGGAVGGGGSGSGGAPPFKSTFSAQTGITVPAATHGQGTQPFDLGCFDNATPANKIALTAGYPTIAADGQVVYAWTGSKTGYCLIGSSGASGQAAGDLAGTYPAPTIAAGKVTEAKMSLADNTTGNVSATKHGFAPKLPNDATKYLDGTGAYAALPLVTSVGNPGIDTNIPTEKAVRDAIGAAGGGTVSSVGLSLPDIFGVADSPVTTTGTINATLIAQAANRVFAGPSTGVDAAPSFRALVAADLPAIGTDAQIIFNDGGVLAGHSGLAYNKSTQGAGIKGPLSLGQASVGSGEINLIGSTSGSAKINTNSDATAVVFDKPLASPGSITLGQAPTGGSVVFNGGTSGSARLGVAADGTALVLTAQGAPPVDVATAQSLAVAIAAITPASIGAPALTGTPTGGNCVKWTLDGTGVEDAGDVCGSGGPGTPSAPYTATLTTATTQTITAATHGQGTMPWLQCLQPNASEMEYVSCGAPTKNASGDITFHFSPAWSGTVVIGSNGVGTYEPALGNPASDGLVLSSTAAGVRSWVVNGSGSMVYPGAGVPSSTGSAWGTSYTVGMGANNLVQLNGSSQLPAVSAALLTNFPTFNQNTTGTAAGLTAQYIDWNAASGGASIANKPTLPTAYGSNPAMNGTASAGASANFSRGDHVHPSDTSREPALGNPAANGYVLSSTTGGVRSWVAATSGASAGSANAVQSSNGSGGFSDSGCTATGGAMTCANGFIGGANYSATGAEQAKPAAPAAGIGNMWYDSTNHLPQYQGSAGTVIGTMVAPKTSRDANKFVTNIDAAGVQQTAAIVDADIPAAIARLAGPTFTGVPAAPTAAADTNTTQIATTAFVIGQASGTNPAMNGTAGAGNSLKYAREDHVHPADTSRAPLVSPSFTTPTLGVATATSINKVTITAPATSATLTIANGKTLTASNTLTLTGTDSSSVAFGGGGTVTYTIASGQTAMPTGALAANTCSASATTATATGALTTDAASVSYASDPTGVTGYGAGTNGGISIRHWVTANTINFKLCNETGSSVTPGALSVNWRITR